MTDYLELLLAVLEAQEESETILRLPRRRRAVGRVDDTGEQEMPAAPQTARTSGAGELLPEEGSGAASTERRQTRDALYRELTSVRTTLRRREQAVQRPEGSTQRRDRGAAVREPEWNAWGAVPATQERARYAALVDAEFQRDARRYDGTLGLL